MNAYSLCSPWDSEAFAGRSSGWGRLPSSRWNSGKVADVIA
jgi:hypothetical protein